MSLTSTIDEIYLQYILNGRKINKVISTKSKATLQKYIKIKEELDFTLYPLLNDRKKMTIDIALTLCKYILNPDIQITIYPSLENKKTKERKEIIMSSMFCEICAGESRHKELLPCCGKMICFECMLHTFEASLNDVTFKYMCCPYCREELPLDYLSQMCHVVGWDGKNGHCTGRYIKEYASVEPWRNTKEYEHMMRVTRSLLYYWNMFKRYKHMVQKIESQNIDSRKNHIGYCFDCVKRNFISRKKFIQNVTKYEKKIHRWLRVTEIGVIPKDCANDMDLTENMFACVACKEKRSDGTIKSCPHCGVNTLRPNECNFVVCQCKGRWCFVCNLRVPNTHEGHNEHFWLGPGSGPYSNKCRISENSDKDKHILQDCNCEHCKKRGGAPICQNIDCMNPTSYNKDYTKWGKRLYFNVLCDTCR